MDSISTTFVFICITVCLLHTTVSQDKAFSSRDGHEHTKLGDDYYRYVRPLINSIQVNCELNLKKRMEEWMEERMEEMINNKIDRQQNLIESQQERIDSLEKGIRLVTTATVQPNPAENAVSGRLEVYVWGQWGTVCDDFFNDADASVACKQLGGEYNGDGKVVPLNGTSYGTGPVWLDDVQCTWLEASLLQCPHAGIGVVDCDHNEDVGVKCYKK